MRIDYDIMVSIAHLGLHPHPQLLPGHLVLSSKKVINFALTYQILMNLLQLGSI